MRRAVILALPVLVLCFSAQVPAQSRGNKSQPPVNLRTPKEPVRSTAVALPPSPEQEAEARKLYEDGLKLSEAEQFPQAAESFQQAVKLNSKYADAYSALGRTYFKMREWQKAVDNLRRAAELHREVQEAKPSESQNENSLASNTFENVRPNDSPIKQSQATMPNAAINPPGPGSKLSTKKGSSENGGPTPNSSGSANAFRSNPPAQFDRQPQTTLPLKSVPENKLTSKPDVSSSAVISNPTAQQQQPATPPKTATAETKQAPRANVASSVVLSNPTAQPGTQQQTATPVKTATPKNKQDATNVSPGAVRSNPPTPPQQTTTPPNNLAAETKQPVSNSGINAARQDSNPSPKPETSEQKIEAATANARSTETLPSVQQTGASQSNLTTNSKTLAAQSHPTQNFEKAAIAPLTTDDGTGLSQVPETDGERVAMNVTPSSQPLETNTVTPAPTTPPTDDIGLTKTYRVGPNDVLDVRVNDSESPKSTLFTITPAGLLEYPLLVEPLSVSGLTVEEIGTRIEEDLKKRALIENPKVIVGVRDYGSHTIIVSGLVKDAGTKFLMREAIPLYVVVADAQPLPEAARVTLVRNEANQVFEVDLMRAADMNLLVRPGDVLTFQPNVTQFVYIGGDVKIPGEKTFRRGLTLTQVILTAGGVTAKATTAQIARDDGRGFLAETSFSLKDISSGKTVDPLLKPGDRILVLR